MLIAENIALYLIIQALVGFWYFRLIYGENRLFLSEDHPERKIWHTTSEEQHAELTYFPPKKEKG